MNPVCDSARKPINCYVGVSQDKRTVAIANWFGIKLTWTHAFFLLEWPDGSRSVFESSWKGVAHAPWDEAHKADRWALFADDRIDINLNAIGGLLGYVNTDAVGRLWAFCLGAESKFYDYPALVGLALRLAFEAWAKITGRVTVLARVAFVCTSFVNETGRVIFDEPYSEQETPSPNEIVCNKHLFMAYSSGAG